MKKIYILFFILILTMSVLASEEEQEQLQLDIIEAENTLIELSDAGFNVRRVNDTLKTAKQIFSAQLLLKEHKRDFTLVSQNLEEIAMLKEQAYVAQDEIVYVYEVYEETKQEKPNINLSEADSLIAEMEFEFDSERYEEAYDLAKEAYAKIIEIEG